MKKKWICTVCGYVHEGDEAPEFCPQCKQPKSKFKELVETEGALQFVDEHVLGVAKGVDPVILEGLNAHFMGECTEVGMYLAMSRQADREGYPEVAEAFKRNCGGPCGRTSYDRCRIVRPSFLGECSCFPLSAWEIASRLVPPPCTSS